MSDTGSPEPGKDTVISEPAVRFELPAELEADRPAELRGVRRDRVRLLVLPRLSGAAIHTRFDTLGDFLNPGDLLVVNNSRTLPALLQACDEHGREVEIRLAQRRSEDTWDVLALDGRIQVGRAGMRLEFGQDLTAAIIERSPDLPFLWRMQFDRCCMDLIDMIYQLGEPVRYSYLERPLPLDYYQTVYATQPGSVEMPSAGRPFSWELLLQLQRAGIGLAAITLHTGLSSSRDDDTDNAYPVNQEEYQVTQAAAQAVNETRQHGGRVVAVGTTVVRALETAAGPDGRLRADHGRTLLRIHAGYQLLVADALLTGLHEPEASHLDMLSAFVAPQRLQAAYLEAIQHGYLWHEFGDMNLII